MLAPEVGALERGASPPTADGHPRGDREKNAARGRLAEVAAVFLRLGFTAFGGPAAHVALMERELVARRAWVTPERFVDLFGTANLLPGPSSSELAIFLGYERAGLVGLLVAGVSFILPAALMTLGIAWGYEKYGALPRIGGALHGIAPVLVAIVLQAIVALAPKVLKAKRLVALAAVALLLAARGVDALPLLLATGACAMLLRPSMPHASPPAASLFLAPAVGLAATTLPQPTTAAIALYFVKVGGSVFGSGYVLLAFLRADLVERFHWLTERQLLDAIIVGQFTPGPVFTTATFLGYLLGGVRGALVATLGIFLPGFVLVAVSRPLVARVRRSPIASAFLDGVNAAALSLMVLVSLQLGRAAISGPSTALLALVSLFSLVRWKLNPTWLIALGAAFGLLVYARA
jgi:chromate transporter